MYRVFFSRYRFIKFWNSLFPDQSMDILSIEKCPLLIGIMRRSVDEDGWAFSSKYQFQLLMSNDMLIYDNDKAIREDILLRLIDFKEKYDKNEKASVSFPYLIYRQNHLLVT